MLTVDQLMRGAVRQSSSNCEHSAQGNRVRNSSIELLRVIAMLMILLHHFVVHNAFDVSRMPVSLPKFIFYMFICFWRQDSSRYLFQYLRMVFA